MNERLPGARVQVPMLDLRAQYAAIRTEVRAAMDRVCDAQEFILGAEVAAFEAEIARFLRCGSAIGVSSGSDALLCALMALGVGPGDEVITTPLTFVATAEAIARLGAVPRFVDVSILTLNLDPERVAAAVGPRTKAILPVHLFGYPADMPELTQIAQRSGLVLAEDAAQALGGALRGRMLGAWGTLGCFSFFPSKPLGAFGDGGLVVTTDPALAQRCRELRVHGTSDRRAYEHTGGNFRLDALQAAVLRVKLRHLEGWTAARRAHAQRYTAGLRHITGIQLPPTSADAAPAYAHYTIRVRDERRDALAAALSARGIETAVYYSRPLHLQPVFAHLQMREGALPCSEQASREVLSLPLYPELTAAQIDTVVEAVHDFF